MATIYLLFFTTRRTGQYNKNSMRISYHCWTESLVDVPVNVVAKCKEHVNK